MVYGAADGGEAVFCGGGVDVFPDGAALCGDGLGFGVDGDATHLGEVDDEAMFD